MKRAYLLIILILCFSLISCERIIPERAVFKRGVVSNNVYVSKSAEIKFIPGPAWSFAGDEELLQMNNVDPSQSEGQICDELSGLQTVYDMSSFSDDGESSVVIIFENKTVNLGISDITLSEYSDKLCESLGEQYAETIISSSKSETVDFLDKEAVQVSVLINSNGGEICQKYVVFDIGDFFVSVCITSRKGETETDSILKLFELPDD